MKNVELENRDILVSVIMPVYNSEKYLEGSLDSIIDQTVKEIEIIVVDDGSTDSSPAIIEEYSKKDQRIITITQGNAGPSKARNTGIKRSRGKWLYFMDSDDTLERTMFQDLLTASDEYDVICSGVTKHYIGEKIHRKVMRPTATATKSEGEFCEYLKLLSVDENQDVIFNYLWNKLFRSSVINNNKIRFDECIKLGEDFIFICEVLKTTARIHTVEKEYYHYFVRGTTSLVGMFDSNELQRRKLVFNTLIDLYKRYNLLEHCFTNLEIREGRNSLNSLKKISYPTCYLSVSQKEEYVDGFLKDERKQYMLNYLSKQKGLKNSIKRFVIKSGKKKLVCRLILLFNR